MYEYFRVSIRATHFVPPTGNDPSVHYANCGNLELRPVVGGAGVALEVVGYSSMTAFWYYYHAVDADPLTAWASGPIVQAPGTFLPDGSGGVAGVPAWLVVRAGAGPTMPAELAFGLRSDGFEDQGPSILRLEGWNGSAWVQLAEWDEIPSWSNGEQRLFLLDAPAAGWSACGAGPDSEWSACGAGPESSWSACGAGPASVWAQA